jgi:hypothetical protein
MTRTELGKLVVTVLKDQADARQLGITEVLVESRSLGRYTQTLGEFELLDDPEGTPVECGACHDGELIRIAEANIKSLESYGHALTRAINRSRIFKEVTRPKPPRPYVDPVHTAIKVTSRDGVPVCDTLESDLLRLAEVQAEFNARPGVLRKYDIPKPPIELKNAFQALDSEVLDDSFALEDDKGAIESIHVGNVPVFDGPDSSFSDDATESEVEEVIVSIPSSEREFETRERESPPFTSSDEYQEAESDASADPPLSSEPAAVHEERDLVAEDDPGPCGNEASFIRGCEAYHPRTGRARIFSPRDHRNREKTPGWQQRVKANVSWFFQVADSAITSDDVKREDREFTFDEDMDYADAQEALGEYELVLRRGVWTPARVSKAERDKHGYYSTY